MEITVYFTQIRVYFMQICIYLNAFQWDDSSVLDLNWIKYNITLVLINLAGAVYQIVGR